MCIRDRYQRRVRDKPPKSPRIAMPQTLLVLGGAGYIGSTVAFRALRSTDMKVIVLDKLMYSGSSLYPFFAMEDRFEFIKADIRMSKQTWRDLLVEKQVDFVFNAAALVGEHICKKYPEDAQQINEDAAILVAEAAAEAGCKRYMYASTCSNFGKTEDFVDETAPTFPLSLYASTKINVENYLTSASNCGGMACTVLRFATIYGLAARVRFDLLIHEFIRDAWNDKRVEIYGPEGWRPFLHVDDAARAVIMVCEQHDTLAPREIFNVGANSQNFQKKQLGEMIQHRLPQAEVVYNHKAVDKRSYKAVSYTHLRAHETPEHLVCRLLLEKKKKKTQRYNKENINTYITHQ
eukprot:TRINITY_DN4250_c0_g5_i8.p1 TRINITY_DN4250_c0_g5~~TRINITY_DN4250_c0_g5_i8.p1  ORF type:complete len:349 (+),score=110.33 TRINITY_DN4250_c0_g5_i8:147-1193(+)